MLGHLWRWLARDAEDLGARQEEDQPFFHENFRRARHCAQEPFEGRLLRFSSGAYPLHSSCRQGDVEVVEYLLQASGDPNVTNDDGEAPLHIVAGAVARPTDCRLINELVSHKAAVDVAEQSGDTPLMVACRYNKLNCVEYLLALQANPNVQSPQGNTPLHALCATGSIARCTDLLLAHGANPFLSNADGRLPTEVICPGSSGPALLRLHQEVARRYRRAVRALLLALNRSGRPEHQLDDMMLRWMFGRDGLVRLFDT
eukprot:GGOE01053105.1.p1 GENE.GGOE01053105.1~~GGOE01053105.1.p1  ORF type:complete len:258 (-),score=50.43 GGOE01053105.1:484-1257(-)